MRNFIGWLVEHGVRTALRFADLVDRAEHWLYNVHDRKYREWNENENRYDPDL